MKKILFLSLLTASLCTMAGNVATFENNETGISLTQANSVWHGAVNPVDSIYIWRSGDFFFPSVVSYGATYFTAFAVSNETDSTSSGWEQPYRSAAGGAYLGNNFATVYVDGFTGHDTVQLVAPDTIPGLFITNNAYTVHSMAQGDYITPGFTSEDWLSLNIIGWYQGSVTDTVTVFLAKNGRYINRWTWFDLSTLGKVDAVTFTMDGSQQTDFGLNTPTYFCMDNFGAACPDGYTAPEQAYFNLNTAVQSQTIRHATNGKIFRNGHLLIIRDGRTFNVIGNEIQ